MADETSVSVTLDAIECGCVLDALSDERNQCLREGKSTDTVNELIVKVANARARKSRGSREER